MRETYMTALLNGATRLTVAKAKRVRKAAPVRVGMRDVWRSRITMGIGVGIPCLSLSLSSIGGRLLQEGHWALGAGSLVLCCSVLAVSLSHLAWAIRDITRSSWWQSWCLAAAVDLSLILGELASVSGFDLWVVPVVMIAVTAVSAVLNCWAFMRHVQH
jgi:hypothetical protein